MAQHAVLTLARTRSFRITHPDGIDVTFPYDQNRTGPTLLMDAWLTKGLPKDRDVQDVWKRNASVDEIRGWSAHFRQADSERVLSALVDGNARFGYPSAALKLLDGLSIEGWRILHVSEDRAIYSGDDAPEESYISRVRYLLMKD